MMNILSLLPVKLSSTIQPNQSITCHLKTFNEAIAGAGGHSRPLYITQQH
jgi:hypothetical protein